MAKPRVPKKKNGDATVSPVEHVEAAAATVADSNSNGEEKKTRKRASGKPSIVKSDARATLVPINLEDEIRRLAYLLSERRGFEPGHEAEDWLAAEVEVRQRYRQHSA